MSRRHLSIRRPTFRNAFGVVERLESRGYLSAAPSIASVTLIDANADKAIGAFVSGAKVDSASGKAYSVRANIGGTAQSVRFVLDGKAVRTESYAPFTIAGDAGADYFAWKPTPGNHTLRIEPFSGRGATGVAGAAKTLKFSASGASTVVPAGTSTSHPLGGNLNTQSDRVQDLAFVDLVKTTRGFYNVAGRKASNGTSAFATVDSNGWPTEDFSFTAVDNTEWNVPVETGVYKMAFQGPAGVKVGGSTGVVATQTSYYTIAGRGGFYTFDVNVSAGVKKLSLTFKSTQGKVKNVRLLQPGYALSTTKTFTDRYVNLLKVTSPAVLRFMDYTKANNDPEIVWYDRPKTTDATQAKATTADPLQPLKGIAWEYCIELANLLGKGAWINVPVMATDDYVRNLAILFRDKLRSDLPIYIEYSNEVWNSAFSQSQWNKSKAVAEVFNNAGSNLNYDKKPVDKTKPGSSNPYANVWADRRFARRTKEISDIFRKAFKDGGKPDPIASKKVRVVLAGKAADQSRFDNELAYLKKFYGDPKNYLYAIGIAPYFNLGATNTQPNATKTDVLAAMNRGVDVYVNGTVLSSAFQRASANGLKLVAYEGGPHTYGAMNIAAKRAASLDPVMQSIVVRYLNNWYSKGGDLFMYYTLGARSYNSPYGTWSITESYSVLNSPKIKAFVQVRRG